MKLAVISDTHLKNYQLKSIENVYPYLENIDYILHCGDIMDIEVLKALEKIAPVEAVWGNVDGEEIRKAFSEKKIIEMAGKKIGIFHGHGEKGKTIDRVWKSFEQDEVDIILFGHSHQPTLQTKSGVLMINPGSPTSKRREKKYSMVILEIKEEIYCQFIFF